MVSHRLHAFAFFCILALPGFALAFQPADLDEKPQAPAELAPEVKELIATATPLNQQQTLFLDRKNKAVFLKAHVALQEGLLEMLCCPQQTKEHESILSVNCSAAAVHAALLAIEAEPGEPVSYDPKFQPPRGEVMAITLIWKEEGKVKRQEAREWVQTVTRRYFGAKLETLPEGFEIPEDSGLFYDRNENQLLFFGKMTPEQKKSLLTLSNDAAYQKAIEQLEQASQPETLEADWVFAGSLFQEDPQTGERRYLAEGGDLICVANFPSAMIDIAARSSADDSQRGYEANPDAVPELGTPVLIKLQRTQDVQPAGQKSSD
ncbi:YdjY domain-containing protein [Rubinisphaera margarita]|uniref:YdjY domain-containing protein n=1 Tax=Rubinisphaera margarita TaxID=2909586 RepID=UPI001EE80A31|nr:YdjY domain-containing protein [Rubinisphaera margarita]MCG6155576.1 YdjY domain-containing protein [Rubinisphaera margarita]